VTNIHALIIDDNSLNIDVLVMLLEQQDATYSSIDSLRKLPEMLDANSNFDVIFLDLEFPHGDGFDALPNLKADPRLFNVPIVAYSVHTSEIDRARRAGFDSFLGKPLSPREFPEQLRRILNGEAVWEVN
jgi:two-component system cell cycle response regulator DivK